MAETFHEHFIEELQDIYHAENQLIKALPKMAKAASTQKLRVAFQKHLTQTRGQVARLERAFKLLDEPAKGKPCEAMKGLVKEGAEVIAEHRKGLVRDVALIGAAQRVEHYEIAAYGTVRAMAALMRHSNVEKLLQQTLDEEGAADQGLTDISVEVNLAAFEKAPGM